MSTTSPQATTDLPSNPSTPSYEPTTVASSATIGSTPTTAVSTSDPSTSQTESPTSDPSETSFVTTPTRIASENNGSLVLPMALSDTLFVVGLSAEGSSSGFETAWIIGIAVGIAVCLICIIVIIVVVKVRRNKKDKSRAPEPAMEMGHYLDPPSKSVALVKPSKPTIREEEESEADFGSQSHPARAQEILPETLPPAPPIPSSALDLPPPPSVPSSTTPAPTRVAPSPSATVNSASNRGSFNPAGPEVKEAELASLRRLLKLKEGELDSASRRTSSNENLSRQDSWRGSQRVKKSTVNLNKKANEMFRDPLDNLDYG